MMPWSQGVRCGSIVIHSAIWFSALRVACHLSGAFNPELLSQREAIEGAIRVQREHDVLHHYLQRHNLVPQLVHLGSASVIGMRASGA